MTETIQRPIMVEQSTVDQARAVRDRMIPTDALAVVPRSGKAVALPRELAEVLSRVIAAVSAGGTVTIGTVPPELTTTEAAAQLGISRPTLMKMIRRGEIPSHKVGSHTRLRTEDVRNHREQRKAARLAALADLRAMDNEVGLNT